MARSIRSNELESRTGRLKLAVRRLPYTARVSPGIRLAYRRNQHASGSWSVQVSDGKSSSSMKRLALADDYETADVTTVMDFWQATDAARKLARAPDGIDAGDRLATIDERAHVAPYGEGVGLVVVVRPTRAREQ